MVAHRWEFVMGATLDTRVLRSVKALFIYADMFVEHEEQNHDSGIVLMIDTGVLFTEA